MKNKPYVIISPPWELVSLQSRWYTSHVNIKPKTIRQCLECSKEFQTYPYLLKKGKHYGRFCSIKCSTKNNPTKIKKGQRLSPNTEFKKGTIPWNFKSNDNMGMQALHTWVKRRLGKPEFCEGCGSKSKKKYEWANKSGEYKRDLDDWIRLCTSCHRKYDMTPSKRVQAITNLVWFKKRLEEFYE